MKVNFDDYDVVVLYSIKLAQSIFGTGAKLKDILGAAE